MQDLKIQISKIQPTNSSLVVVPPKERFNAPISSLDVVLVRRTLYSVRDDWYDIGGELNAPFNTLDSIKDKHGDSKDYLLHTLREWFKWGIRDCFTWGTIVDALRSPVIGHDELANTIEATYCVKNN